MDFFEHQHVARKRTGRLVILFIAAVLGIIALVYVTLATILIVWADAGVSPADPRLILGVAGSVSVVVLFASLYKLSELRAGGRIIAESLGGRLLDSGTADATERKILNVVEEMAIASGVPVPPVYLMDNEQAINAFAAGYSPSDAVIGVTRGCVELLSRDELQGVMAHEFSHILNGDMRLNIRLIGVIFGILAIGTIGSVILRGMAYSGGSRRRGGKSDGSSALIMLAIGLALLIIGSLGVFFGNLIKAAVSRQREFLADASAVQFTRNPEGISGALQKIGGLASGAMLRHPKAAEASHMYFGEGVPHWLGGMMATHPPLAQRIKRIDPGWNGKFPEVQPLQTTQQRQERYQREHTDSSALGQRMAAARMGLAGAAATPLVQQVGNPTPQHVEHARGMLDALDEQVRDAAHEPYGARAVIYAMLLDGRDDVLRDRQLQALQRDADPDVVRLTQKLAGPVTNIDPSSRLAVIDVTLPALRKLAVSQYQTFRKNIDALIDADERVDLKEWVIRRIVVRHLRQQFEDVRPPVVQYYNLRGVLEPCAVLLSTLAYVGHREKEPATTAFRAGASAMGLGDLSPKPPSACTMTALGEALDALNQVTPRAKRHVIAGAATCIASDRTATVNEVELLRAICDTLDCPMPPLLPGQKLV